MWTSVTCPECTRVTNWLKLVCCLRSPGCRTCHIARNITISRTQRSSVLCDCFTSTSVGIFALGGGAASVPRASATIYYVRCVTSRSHRIQPPFVLAPATNHGNVVGKAAQMFDHAGAEALERRQKLRSDTDT